MSIGLGDKDDIRILDQLLVVKCKLLDGDDARYAISIAISLFSLLSAKYAVYYFHFMG
jgi:hypothetical protein